MLTSIGQYAMAKKQIIRQVTEAITGLDKLVLITLGGAFGLAASLLVGNFLLYTLSRVVEALFDLVKNGIFSG